MKKILNEYKKVVWPKPKSTIQMTVIVILLTLFIVFMIWSFDYLFELILKNLKEIFKK